MPKKISCVIYDMDGLLLDTEGIYTEVTHEIVKEHGKTFDWSIKKKIIGRRSIDAAQIIVDSLDLPFSAQDYLDARKDVLVERFKNTKSMPGAKELTTHLFENGIPQALATSSASPMFESKYEKHKEWFSQFKQIVRGDDPELKNGKPAPDIFLLAAERMGFDPSECLVFEDAPSGTAAGNAAGMHVVAVPDPNMDRAQYQGVSQFLSSLEEFEPTEWSLPAFKTS